MATNTKKDLQLIQFKYRQSTKAMTNIEKMIKNGGVIHWLHHSVDESRRSVGHRFTGSISIGRGFRSGLRLREESSTF